MEISPVTRYLIRAAFATALAFLSALGAAMPDGISGTEWIIIATATVTAGSAWLGLGAASPTLEPRVGNTADWAEGAARAENATKA